MVEKKKESDLLLNLKQADTAKDSALRILKNHGYSDVVIPPPIERNVQIDRIYFLVKVGRSYKPRTVFIKAALQENSVELETFKGWLIDKPEGFCY